MDSELVLYIGGVFDGKLLVEFITCEKVEEIKFQLYNVVTNEVVSEYLSLDKMFHSFGGLKPSLYQASAIVKFSTKCLEFSSNTLDVHKYLQFQNHKRDVLSVESIRCNLERTNPFRFGKKYIYKHHLYNNVNEYRIEVGFKCPKSCEDFLKTTKYRFCRVFTDRECDECHLKNPVRPDDVGCNSDESCEPGVRYGKRFKDDELCMKERFQNNKAHYPADEHYKDGESCHREGHGSEKCCSKKRRFNSAYYYRLMYFLDEKIPRDKLIQVAQELDASKCIDYTSITPLSVFKSADKENKYGLCDNHVQHCGERDLEAKQLYLGPHPGLNVLEAWKYDATGYRSVTHMIDSGFYPHVDLCHNNVLVDSDRGRDPEHGVATAGIVCGDKNGFGVTGIAYSGRYVVHDTTRLIDAHRIAEPGQVLAINVEFELYLPHGRYVLPVTDNLGLWIRFACAAEFGSIIMCNAGNGGLDLYHCQMFNDHGDSGANLVAAVDSMTLKPTEKTNRNHRSIVFNAWGNCVTTCGYGPLKVSKYPNAVYTENYQGTSAALPQCVGVVSVLLAKLKSLNITLNCWELRKLILMFGDTQNVTLGAGTLPNLGCLIREIQEWVIC